MLLRNKLLTTQLITNMLVRLEMAELALVDYFVMGEAIGIVATLFVSFYYSRKQMRKLYRYRNQDPKELTPINIERPELIK